MSSGFDSWLAYHIEQLPAKNDLIVFCPLGENQIMAYQALIASDGELPIASHPDIMQMCSSSCGGKIGVIAVLVTRKSLPCIAPFVRFLAELLASCAGG